MENSSIFVIVNIRILSLNNEGRVLTYYVVNNSATAVHHSLRYQRYFISEYDKHLPSTAKEIAWLKIQISVFLV